MAESNNDNNANSIIKSIECSPEFLQMIKGTTIATSITKVDRIKCAICGDKKVGKSSLVARTARKPILQYDFDDRRESIAGIPGVVIKTLVDIDTNAPTAWGTLESDIGTLEWLKSENKLDINSLCLDSMTFLRQYADNQMMKDTKLSRSATIGSMKYNISAGWDAINYTQRMMAQLLRRIFALDIDVYCVFHTRPEKDRAKSTKDNTVYTDKLTIEPQNLAELLAMFNEVWRCYLDESGNFKVQTKADYYFGAATALSIDNVEDPDIEAMLRKHEQNYKK